MIYKCKYTSKIENFSFSYFPWVRKCEIKHAVSKSNSFDDMNDGKIVTRSPLTLIEADTWTEIHNNNNKASHIPL